MITRDEIMTISPRLIRLYKRCSRYCQIGPKTIPRRRIALLFCTLFPKPGTGEMRRILLSTLKILISAALLVFLAAQGRPGRAVRPHRRFQPGLDRRGDCCDVSADIHRRAAVARDQRGMWCAAADQAGDALQRDRNLLQPDTALLDRRRRGQAVAGGAQRPRLAGGDLFHLRRPRHRPDRARGGDRREPALELSPDHRSARQVGVAVRRFRGACRRPRISSARPAAVAVAEALVGYPPLPRLLGHRQSRPVQPRARPESRGAVAIGACTRRRHRLVRGAVDRSSGGVRPDLPARSTGHADHHAADLDRRLGRP